MENERLPVIPWPPKSFAHLQISSIVGLFAIICITESKEVGAARIAFVSFLIAFSIMIISFWKFLKDMRAQNAVKENE